MRCLLIAAASVTAGLTLASCGQDRAVSGSPAAPTPVSPTAVSRNLSGYIYDTAFRALPGATIVVLNGAQAGMVMTTDADGRFGYAGTFGPPVSLRATKEGFATADTTVIIGAVDAYAFFNLSPITPPVSVASNYTLTITADTACTSLPDVARERSYAVTLTPNTRSRPSNTFFDGLVVGGHFAPYANVFWVGVAGDYVAVSLQGEGPSIVEQIGPATYVSYYGLAGATIAGSSVSTVAAQFAGEIEYCELNAPINQYYDCSPALAASRQRCTSTTSRLTLTPR